MDKIETLKDIFGAENITLDSSSLIVNGKKYPVVNDVIILTGPEQYTDFVKKSIRAGKETGGADKTENFAEDVQFSFGEEWKKYNCLLPEHREEFGRYFDIVDLRKLSGKRACDLGCGMGRWSWFLKDVCKELILVDFSDAIFIARKNLAAWGNCLFFMGDLKRLPFRDNFADFLFSLGVLHHLPTPCLDEVRNLKRFSPSLLIFLYYALDNRPLHFRIILRIVTGIRGNICGIRSRRFRKLFSLAGTYLVYMPMIFMGRLLKPLKLGSHVPLYDFYHDKSAKRIEQDVYDRFFTSIEQRVSKKEILGLKDTFSEITVAEGLPYWHFLCVR